jgi:hypothetical protein
MKNGEEGMKTDESAKASFPSLIFNGLGRACRVADEVFVSEILAQILFSEGSILNSI